MFKVNNSLKWSDIFDVNCFYLESHNFNICIIFIRHFFTSDEMELKHMMEKLGQAKTHLEIKKMIAEVDTNNSGTIHYREFLNMMLGKRSSVISRFFLLSDSRKGNTNFSLNN